MLLETTRLLIRPFSLNDLDEAYNVLDTHPDVWRYDPGYAPTLERRERLLQFRVLEYEQHGFGCMALILRNTAQLIGYCGLQLYLWEHEPYSTPEIELFYKLGRDFWGKGYALEAGQAMIDYAFRELRLVRIVSHALRDNTHSIVLMQRLGMHVRPDPLRPNEVIGIIENNQT